MSHLVKRSHAAELIGITPIALNNYIARVKPEWYLEEQGLVDTTLTSFIEYKEKKTHRKIEKIKEAQGDEEEQSELREQMQSIKMRTTIATLEKKEADAEKQKLEVMKMKEELVSKDIVRIACIGILEQTNQALLHSANNLVDDCISAVRAGKSRHEVEHVLIKHIEKIIVRGKNAISKTIK